jgi:hypothetical protein
MPENGAGALTIVTHENSIVTNGRQLDMPGGGEDAPSASR